MSGVRLPTSVLVKIEGEPYLTRARAHIVAYMDWRRAWSAFAESRGAEGHGYSTSGLNFGRKRQPEGWTKPDGKDGWSRPKKGHADIQTMAALPRCPGAWSIFSDHFINTLQHKSPEGYGGMGTIGGHWNAADLGWIDNDLIYARVPHPANAAANHLADYPDNTITTPGAVDWKMPCGLTIVSQAQVNLWHAQAALNEKREAAPSASLAPEER